MNKTLKISPTVRKRITFALLLNFLFSTIFFVIPKKECNGTCSIDNVSHNCSDMKTTNCCCDMMGMKDDISTSHKCRKEFSKNTCDYKFTINDDLTFIVPKTAESKIILTTLSILDLSIDQDYSRTYTFAHNVTSDIGPPIYITVSSFLI